MNTFQDRVVLITGAGSGIGRQLARSLSNLGARIGGIDVQSDGLDALKGELNGRVCVTAVADVTDLPALRKAVAGVEAEAGPTDILIASAGIGRETSATAYSAEDVGQVIAVNLTGVSNSIGAVLGGMCQRRSGHLVVLSSLASYHGVPRMAGYCASKAGVNALMESIRVELRPLGIACTTICPGWIRTPMTAPFGLPAKTLLEPEDAVRRMIEAIRAHRRFLAFPPRDLWPVRLLRYLPGPMSDWLAYRYLLQYQSLKGPGA
jgi:NAD(P)-dependent dehydrogenase (short-subunit alcohol dehydrogenase family)